MAGTKSISIVREGNTDLKGAARSESVSQEGAFKRAARGAAIGAAMAAAVASAGCATMGPDQTAGTVIGGVLGGVLGNNIGQGYGREAATIAGTMIGAYIGGGIGKTMDSQDKLMAQQALEKNTNGTPTSWVNPNNGNRYSVTPTNAYVNQNNAPCRQYVTTALINGQAEKITGTACRQPDGTWKPVNQ